MTKDADSLLADPGLDADTRRYLARFFAWGAQPTVDAYCDLFAPGGTLLDAGMDQPLSGPEIRAAITRVLALLPDFHFTPVRIVHEGRHVFVLARNRATLAGAPLAWDAVYAMTLEGDHVRAGRRYYDQAAITGGGSLFDGDALAAAEAGCDAPGADAAAPWQAGTRLDLAARADAWNRLDIPAILAPVATAHLQVPGVAQPIARVAQVAQVLARFGTLTPERHFTAGAVAAMPAAIAIEWLGTIGAPDARRRFAMVEILDAPGMEPREWRLAFDTLGLRAGAAEGVQLRDHVHARGG